MVLRKQLAPKHQQDQDHKVLDFWKKREEPALLYIKGGCVEKVSSFKFLGVHLSEDLIWKNNTIQVVREAQQRLNFQASGFGLPLGRTADRDCPQLWSVLLRLRALIS
uniref:Alkylated DNA repair protein AlkB homologue 8 N-terminal domain-containing protein n=1 Tax=Micrurus spixii TaxID=129469 RepID=A0A2D4LF87_9SAUR